VVLQPEIAESWEYVEPTVLEFKIREGITWHDLPPLNGRALTADDVVYTLNERYVKGLAGKGYVGAEFYDRAEAVDAQTVRVHMKKPFSGFINAFTSGNRQGAIVAPEITSEEDLKDPTKSWVGTGPFMFEEFLSGVKVSFERNPNYFKDGLPYADRIEAHVIPDAATRLAALRSGQINIFPAAGPQAMQQVQKTNPDYFTKSCPSLFHMGIRLRLDKEPWSDVRVRRALSMSLDRDAIVSAALRGDGEPVLQAWPLDPEALKLSEFPDEVQQYMQYNPTKAKELLAEAGYPDGFSTSVVWTAQYGSPWQEVAETILTMMRAVGINAEFDMHAYGPFLGKGNTLSYDDVYFGWTNSFDFSDLASTYYWSGYQPPNTLSLAPDAHLDEIVARLWASDDSSRPAIVKELQIYVADKSYRVTSPVWGNGIMTRPEIKNVGWRGTNKMYHQIFENAWIERK
jgi:peptide/nickel transport system substrate-binding protein